MADYESGGRTGQKLRTRQALKAAATSLIAAGARPTVLQVAEAAGISKSTAYRYFPSQELMYAEVLLTTTLAADRKKLAAAADGDGDAATRVERLVRADQAMTAKHEHALRIGLRAYYLLIDSYPEVPLEPSNRVTYLTTALAPVADQLSDAALRRLVGALALCVGIEAATITQVGCQLSTEEAEEVRRWAAAALLRSALDEAGG